MSEHTSGPWTTTEIMAYVAGFEITDADGSIIARVMKAGKGMALPSQANARLIAAAPELLEALQSFERTMWWSRHSFEVLEKDSTMRQMFRAAIAKATGVTNAN